MKKKKVKYTLKDILFVLIGIIIIVVITVIVFDTQLRMNKQSEEFCNNKYGVDNWYYNETTGTGDFKYYIGQVWSCVPKE
jgi:nitrate/TMAO reductase-like tetraheme cytochrome c subunit